MGQWASLEQGWGSSVRKPTEMRPGRGQNEHSWPPKTLTIAGEVLRKSMLEALRQKLWPRLGTRGAQEAPRDQTLQKPTVFISFWRPTCWGESFRTSCNCPNSGAGGSPEGYLKVSKDGYLQVSRFRRNRTQGTGDCMLLVSHACGRKRPANLKLYHYRPAAITITITE